MYSLKWKKKPDFFLVRSFRPSNVNQVSKFMYLCKQFLKANDKTNDFLIKYSKKTTTTETAATNNVEKQFLRSKHCFVNHKQHIFFFFKKVKQNEVLH